MLSSEMSCDVRSVRDEYSAKGEPKARLTMHDEFDVDGW